MLPKIPNLRHLRAVELIEASGSVVDAARAVHLSQSAVTQALRSLEESFGATLFERTGTGMRPTPAGSALIRRVRRAFERLQRIAREVDEPGRAGEPAHHLFSATQLRALVAVVRSGGYSLAARELDLSQPSVFRAAKDFEALFEKPLFRRTSGGIEPTREARRLAREASLALAEIRQGIDEICEQSGGTGSEIIVGCLPLARSGLLPDTVTSTLRRYPDARVRIIDGAYDELLHGLLDGAIDLIIGALRDPAPAGHIRQVHLFDDALSIIVRAGHPLLCEQSLSEDELARLEWILPKKGTPARTHFDRYFVEHAFVEPRRIVESSSLIVTRGLLLRSDRAAILSNRAVQLELEHGTLAELTAPLPDTQRSIGIAMRDGWQPTALQQAFIDELHACAACESQTGYIAA